MESKAVNILLGANKPHLLNKSDCVWIIVAGEVEVYYASLNEEGKIKSSRKFLYQASKGEILFSLQEPDIHKDVSLVAVSSEAKLIEVRKEFLANLNPNQLTRKIEKWVLKMGECLLGISVPRVYQDLESNTTYELWKGEYVYPSKGLRWVSLLEGELSIYGAKGKPVRDYDKIVKGYIPVTRHLFMQVNSEDARVAVIPTIDVVQDEISLMLGLQYLQRFFMARIESLIQAERQDDNKSIAARLSNNKSMLEGSLGALKSIIDENDIQVFQQSTTNNTLLATCQLIGRETGFDFESPQYLDENAQSTLNQIKAIAQVSNVRVRKVILRGTWWKEENGHLLAFTEEGKRPVALIQNSPDSYQIKDVSTKSSEKVNAQIANSLDPIAYMFFFAFEGPMDSVKKIGAFALKGLKREIGFILLASLLGSILALFTPILSGILFDDVIPQADRSFLVEVAGIMIIVGIVSALLNLIKSVLRLRVETKSNINIQAALMDHLLRLPVSFYQRFSAGDLTIRALSINSIRRVFSHTLLDAILSGAFTAVNLGLLFYYSAKLAWIGIALALLAVLFVFLIGLAKLKYDREIAKHEGDIQGMLFGFLTGISKIRISGAEKRVFAIWANKFGILRSLGYKSVNLENYSSIFINSFPLFTNIIFFGGIFYFLQKVAEPGAEMISVGVFMAFISAFKLFLNDSLSISNAMISSLRIIPIYERMKPILEEAPESTKGSADPGEVMGDIEMNAVTFRYHPDQAPVLRDISFRIKAGEMVAFVGPSGSGKSTIMRLLLGFEEPESGSIYYDGQAYESLNKELVRRQIGVVLQDGALMADSIYKNIVGSSELSLEEAMEAVEMAGMENDIKQMPMGMHTVISEGGSTFSGGQRQRLMIARAIVHKPRILFMDEATSALDNRTQSIVSESLEKLQATRIVIAHRLSTVINADRIYVVESGRIVESGTYHELIKNDGLFAKLAKRQIA